MNTTTRTQQKSSTTVSREVLRRLKAARAKNSELKQAGNLPSPTKDWSKDSVTSLKVALSAGHAVCE